MIPVSEPLLAKRKLLSSIANRQYELLRFCQKERERRCRQLVNLEEKKRITKDLNERFTKAAVVFVTDYKGLDVAAINDLPTNVETFNDIGPGSQKWL